MFGKLAQAQHKAIIESDQLRMICEAANDTNGDLGSDEICMEELDQVMASDAETVTQEEIDQFEALIGEIADSKDKTKDVANMSKAEIESHIASVTTPDTIAAINT